MGSITEGTSLVSFQTFFEGWLVRQQQYLNELLCVQNNEGYDSEEDLKNLIARVLEHYQQYYDQKSRAAHENVFMFFSPPWFSSLERTFLWIAGFKPGLAFRLVSSSVGDLSEEKARIMDQLRAETKAAERELGEEMARVQESVAAPPLSELARRAERRVDGETRDVQSAIEMLGSAMEGLLESADHLRMNVALKVMEILTPAQTVRLLAAAAQSHFRIRSWGLQRDAQTRV